MCSSAVLLVEGRSGLSALCLTYAEFHQTLKQIAQYLDEPEKIGDFGAACKKLHVDLKAE